MEPSLIEVPGGGLSKVDFQGIFTRNNMIKMANNFVPGRQLPDAPSYVPLTSKQKFELFLTHSYSADMFVGTTFDALTAQATGAYPEYGGGMAGYGHRYAAALVTAEASSLFGRWLFPTMLHQDPRYFRSGRGNVGNRMAYAASRVILTRSDDGRTVINSSLILSLLFTSALANGYIPYRDESVAGTIENSLNGLGARAQTNLLNEFWPDIKAMLVKREPKRMRHWQERWDDFSTPQNSKK